MTTAITEESKKNNENKNNIKNLSRKTNERGKTRREGTFYLIQIKKKQFYKKLQNITLITSTKTRTQDQRI